MKDMADGSRSSVRVISEEEAKDRCNAAAYSACLVHVQAKGKFEAVCAVYFPVCVPTLACVRYVCHTAFAVCAIV